MWVKASQVVSPGFYISQGPKAGSYPELVKLWQDPFGALMYTSGSTWVKFPQGFENCLCQKIQLPVPEVSSETK
jgi:hypothetical protein